MTDLDVMAYASMHLAELEAETERLSIENQMLDWVNVEDRLPFLRHVVHNLSESDLVLVMCTSTKSVYTSQASKGQPGSPFVTVARRYRYDTIGDRESGWYPVHSGLGDIKVIHWIPIPPVPTQ